MKTNLYPFHPSPKKVLFDSIIIHRENNISSADVCMYVDMCVCIDFDSSLATPFYLEL